MSGLSDWQAPPKRYAVSADDLEAIDKLQYRLSGLAKYLGLCSFAFVSAVYQFVLFGFSAKWLFAAICCVLAMAFTVFLFISRRRQLRAVFRSIRRREIHPE